MRHDAGVDTSYCVCTCTVYILPPYSLGTRQRALYVCWERIVHVRLTIHLQMWIWKWHSSNSDDGILCHSEVQKQARQA